MIVYCDSSVLLKRIIDEAGSADMRTQIQQFVSSGVAVATSSLGELEVSRVCRRYFGEGGLDDARVALEDIAILDMSTVVLRSAADIPARYLRSIDAIHVASAFTIRADLVLTSDRQMRAACAELGLLVGP